MPPKRLEKLLNPNADKGLGAIVRRAKELDSLTEALRRALSAEEAAGLVAANIRDDGELVVLAESPAWAARLRFEEDRLLEAARNTGATVTSCKVRVGRR
jgi:hypothetical protein